MKLPERRAATKLDGSHAERGKLLQKLPALWAFLGDRHYEGTDQLRDGGVIQIQAVAGEWQVTLREDTSGLRVRLSLDTLDGFWEFLEARLAAEDAQWEENPYARPRAKLKKKKGG